MYNLIAEKLLAGKWILLRNSRLFNVKIVRFKRNSYNLGMEFSDLR